MLYSNELIMTHDFIAQILGVQRSGITGAAGKLKKEGLIDYKRGVIIILNRSGLETQSCECYHIIKMELNTLLNSL